MGVPIRGNDFTWFDLTGLNLAGLNLTGDIFGAGLDLIVGLNLPEFNGLNLT